MSEDGRSTFVTELKAEGAADVAKQRDELERLKGSVEKSTDSLGKMNRAYRNLKIGGLENTEEAKKLKLRIDGLKKSVGETQLKMLQYKGGLGLTSKAAKQFREEQTRGTYSAQKFTGAIKMGGGPLAAFTGKTEGLASGLGKVGLAGAAIAGTVAIVALNVAIVASLVSLGKMAVGAADAYRSEKLSIEGMTKVWRGYFGFMQRAPGNADKMQQSINAIASDSPLARSEILSLNAQLYRMGLRGDRLTTSLKAVALGEAAAGEEGKQMGINMVAGAALFGRSVSGAAAIIKSKFGGIVERQMLALPVQTAKAKESLQALFRGVKVEPLLRGIDKVLGLIKQGSVQSDAWSGIIETLFNPLFKDAEKGGYVVQTFFNKVTILALNAAIAWEDMSSSFTLQRVGIKSMSDLLVKAVGLTSKLAVSVLRGAQGTIWFVTTMERLASICGIVLRTVYAIGNGIHTWTETGEFNKGDWLDIGARIKALGDFDTERSGIQLIQGLINGIKDATPYLEKAAAESGDAAKKAFDASQGIHSPSVRWRWSGRQLPLGGAIGIRDTAPVMRGAAAGVLGSIGTARPAPSLGGGSMMSSIGPRVSVGQLVVQGGAAPSMVTIPLAELRSMVASLFEGIAIQKGAHV